MSSISSQTLNPFTTPKEVKKQPADPIDGKLGFFDETENYFDELETQKFISQESFRMEPAAAVAEAAVAEAEMIIQEAVQAKPASEPNVIYGEYQGSLDIQGSTSTFIEQTAELKVDLSGPREVNISPSEQQDLFTSLFSVGSDKAKDVAAKTASTIADLGKTTLNVAADTIGKDILGFRQEQPKSTEEIEKANKAALQRAHEQKFRENIPGPTPEVKVFKLDSVDSKKPQVITKEQVEAVFGARLTGLHINETGELKAYVKTEVEKGLDEQAKQQEKAAERQKVLSMATKKGGLAQGELDKGFENPNHPTKATG